MVDLLRPLRVNAVELLRQPGPVRTVEVVDLDGRADRDATTSGSPVTIHVRSAARGPDDGIVVNGTVTAPWHEVCRRCLPTSRARPVGVVEELYQIHPSDPDAFPIEDDQLDLVPLVRETVLLELDLDAAVP